MAYGGLKQINGRRRGIARNSASKHRIQPEYRYVQADAEPGLPNPSRETKLSGANGDREKIIFPVQLTTSRIGNLTRLILTLAICDDHTIHTYKQSMGVNIFPSRFTPCV